MADEPFHLDSEVPSYPCIPFPLVSEDTHDLFGLQPDLNSNNMTSSNEKIVSSKTNGELTSSKVFRHTLQSSLSSAVMKAAQLGGIETPDISEELDLDSCLLYRLFALGSLDSLSIGIPNSGSQWIHGCSSSSESSSGGTLNSLGLHRSPNSKVFQNLPSSFFGSLTRNFNGDTAPLRCFPSNTMQNHRKFKQNRRKNVPTLQTEICGIPSFTPEQTDLRTTFASTMEGFRNLVPTQSSSLLPSVPVKLFVNRIPKWMTNSQLYEVFAPFGHVVDCNILKDPGGSRG